MNGIKAVLFVFKEHIMDKNFVGNSINNIWMKNYLKCDHDVIINEEPINADSFAFNFILDDICSDICLKQLSRAGYIISTSSIESYHSLALSYKPKRYHL